jgi:hypothetical protein
MSKKICINWQSCSKIKCSHKIPHIQSEQCDLICDYYPNNCVCISINLIRKQKLEKLNQKYEI